MSTNIITKQVSICQPVSTILEMFGILSGEQFSFNQRARLNEINETISCFIALFNRTEPREGSSFNKPGTSRRILLVENNESISFIQKNLLLKLGC